MSIIIIGSGVAGTTIAKSFLDAGQGPVTMLEAGPTIAMADPANWFNVITGGKPPYTACYDEKEDFSSSGLDPWNIVGGRVIGGGGSTLHFGGWLPRFKPEDFLYKTHTGEGIDWPFSYEDLEPYYCQAEAYLGVSGDSKDQDPPRTKPYPFKAAPYPLLMGPFIETLEKLDISYTHMPVSRYARDYNSQSACRTTGTCKYCPVGGRFTGDQPLAALAQNNQFKLILNAPATQILMESKTTVAGIKYTDSTTGKSFTLDADTVFICAGAFETPKLLLNSKNNYWPNGIGNSNDLVGRYLMASPYFYASGIIQSNPKKLERELGFPSLCSRYYDTPDYQKAGKFFFNADYALPHLDIASLMAQGQPATEIVNAAIGQASFNLQGTMAATPRFENRVTPGNTLTRFDLPTTLIDTPQPIYKKDSADNYINQMVNILEKMGCTVTAQGGYPQRGDHAMSTCRMASSEADGVVGADLKVFGTDNLYIVGNSVFPSMGAANPTLTLVALTFRFLDQYFLNN